MARRTLEMMSLTAVLAVAVRFARQRLAVAFLAVAVVLFGATVSCAVDAEPVGPELPVPGPNLCNPERKDFPEAAFRLVAEDVKASLLDPAGGCMTFRLEYDGVEGCWKHNGIPTTLAVQPPSYWLNRNMAGCITVEVEAIDGTFSGVNVESSTEAVNVEWLDSTSFAIRYHSRGVSTVRVWNGDGSGGVSFSVLSGEEIPMTGVALEYRGVNYEMFRFPESEFQAMKSQRRYMIREWLEEAEDRFETGVRLRIIGPVPYNATEHNVLGVLDDVIMTGGENFDEMWAENEKKNPDFRWFPRRRGAVPPFDLRLFPWELCGMDIVVFDKIGSETLKLRRTLNGVSEIFAISIPFSKSTYDWTMAQEY